MTFLLSICMLYLFFFCPFIFHLSVSLYLKEFFNCKKHIIFFSDLRLLVVLLSSFLFL